MTIRLFTCDCGHKLRFGATECGKCWERTPFQNHKSAALLFAGAIVTGLIVLTIATR